MPKVSYAFFAAGALLGLAGMIWGEQMGRTHDHGMLMPHAHLNVLGWTGLSIMGAFYGLAGKSVPGPMAWLNFSLSLVGVVNLVVGMALLVSGDKGYTPYVIVGAALSIAGMALFILNIFIAALRKPAI